MKTKFFENSHFFGTLPTLKFWLFFNNFSKIAWAKNFEISFFWSVFDTEKHGQIFFPKFELFGFLRNKVWYQPFTLSTGKILPRLCYLIDFKTLYFKTRKILLLHIKIDNPFTDSWCHTEIFVDFTPLGVLSNDCGSYSVSETKVFSPTKDHTNTSATGCVDSIRFVWLWVTISYFLMCC